MLGFIEAGINKLTSAINKLVSFIPGLDFEIPEVQFNIFEGLINSLQETSEKTASELSTAQHQLDQLLEVETELGAALVDGVKQVGTTIIDLLKPITELPERFREQFRIGETPTFSSIGPGGTDGYESTPAGARDEQDKVTPEQEQIDQDIERFRNDLESTLSRTFRDGNFDQLGNALLTNIRNQFTDRIASNLSDFIGNFFSGLFKGGGLFGGGGGGLFGGGAGIFGGLFGGIFHEGGVVPGSRGQQKLILAEAGELVVPPNAINSFGGAQININQQITGNVDQATRRALRQSANEISDAVYANFRERGVVT